MWLPPARVPGSLCVSARLASVPLSSLRAPRRRAAATCAAIIPGDSLLETTTVGGLGTFTSIFQNLITARILLSWFPQVASQPALRPLFTLCDPFLGVFRTVVPSVFGLDISPILAIFLLQGIGSASVALGAELPSDRPPIGAGRGDRANPLARRHALPAPLRNLLRR
jgi:YggT family protein